MLPGQSEYSEAVSVCSTCRRRDDGRRPCMLRLFSYTVLLCAVFRSWTAKAEEELELAFLGLDEFNQVLSISAL